MAISIIVLGYLTAAGDGTGAAPAGAVTTGTGTAAPVVATILPAARAKTQNLGAYRIVADTTWRLPPYGYGSSTATCSAGLVPTGGGETNTSNGNFFLTDSYPTGANSWTVYVKNVANEIQSFTAYATCGS